MQLTDKSQEKKNLQRRARSIATFFFSYSRAQFFCLLFKHDKYVDVDADDDCVMTTMMVIWNKYLFSKMKFIYLFVYPSWHPSISSTSPTDALCRLYCNHTPNAHVKTNIICNNYVNPSKLVAAEWFAEKENR